MDEDYKTLGLRFFDILQKEASGKGVENSSTSQHDEAEEAELVSLCLGRIPKEPKNEIKSTKPKKNGNLEAFLTLGLDSKCQTQTKEEAETEKTWKTNKPEKAKLGDDETSEQVPTKRARVCVRARCDTATVGIDHQSLLTQ